MELNVRFANCNDLNDCVELDLHKNSKIISNKISMNEVIVAEKEGQIVGCLKIEYIWTHIPFISYIVVKNNFKSSGVGRRMLSFLENYQRKQGQLFLLSSTMTNAILPQKWHLKMGFTECGILCGINDNNVGEIFYKKNL